MEGNRDRERKELKKEERIRISDRRGEEGEVRKE